MIVTPFSTEIRRIRDAETDLDWGLVPTMGYLHEGHLRLIRAARQENDRVAVSIFVNPIQFNSASDLAAYPRDNDRDLRLLEQEGVYLVWIPAVEEMYPPGFQTHVTVQELTKPLEGGSRPGHFRGVTTVVAKLLHVFAPRRAYFGQKDAQQLAVIRRMVRDLNFPVQIVAVPTVREPDGLAMSSRNARLTSTARQQATCLYLALEKVRALFGLGERASAPLLQAIREVILAQPLAKIDYLSIADPETLQEITRIDKTALVSLAVVVDGVRLIDNIVIGS